MEASEMSMNRWTDTQNVVYKYNRILALKRKEILTSAAIWMHLEGIMLSDIKIKLCVTQHT